MQAITDGLSAILRNLLPLAGALILGLGLYILSFCTCIGWIFLLPLLSYGTFRFLAEMIDGEARVSTMFSGARDYGKTFLSMWGAMLLFFLLMVPFYLVDFGMMSALGPVTAAWVRIFLLALYGLLLVRFQMTFFLVAEDRMGPLDAFSQSWSVTGPVWGRLMLLQLLNSLLLAPAQVMVAGAQMLLPPLSELLPDPSVILEQLSSLIGLYLGAAAVATLAFTLNLSFLAAAYRQLLGRSE